jgi:hypothetical protein
MHLIALAGGARTLRCRAKWCGEMETIFRTILIGIGATLVMDLWGLLLNRVFRMPLSNYALVGRWLGHMPAGRFMHASIAAAPAVPGEKIIGWTAHFAIGIAFAGLLVAIFGESWVRQPSIGPALLVGVVTVAAPYFIMQPGMGLGIAAAKAPKPNVVRLRSLVTHIVFGLGLYLSALVLAQVMPS